MFKFLPLIAKIVGNVVTFAKNVVFEGSVGIGTTTLTNLLNIKSSAPGKGMRIVSSSSTNPIVTVVEQSAHADSGQIEVYKAGSPVVHIDGYFANINVPVDGTASSGGINLGAGYDLRLYHDGTNSFISNLTGDLKCVYPWGKNFKVIANGWEAVTIDDSGYHTYYIAGTVSGGGIDCYQPSLPTASRMRIFIGKAKADNQGAFLDFRYDSAASSEIDLMVYGDDQSKCFRVYKGYKMHMGSAIGDCEIKFDGLTQPKRKIVDIGDWDMDATVTVNVAHGLTLANIRGVTGMVRSDSGNNQYTIDGNNVSTISDVFIVNLDSTNVVLERKLGGFFDSATFDSTSYNRGWLIIDYV